MIRTPVLPFLLVRMLAVLMTILVIFMAVSRVIAVLLPYVIWQMVHGITIHLFCLMTCTMLVKMLTIIAVSLTGITAPMKSLVLMDIPMVLLLRRSTVMTQARASIVQATRAMHSTPN